MRNNKAAMRTEGKVINANIRRARDSGKKAVKVINNMVIMQKHGTATALSLECAP